MNIINLLRNDSSREILFQVDSPDYCRTRTEAEIFDHLGKLCAGLNKLGINKDDKILFMSGPLIETLELILACINIGATAVPIDPYLGANVINNIIRNIKPACCVIEEPLRQDLAAAFDDNEMIFIAIKQTAFIYNKNCILFDSLLDNPGNHDIPGNFSCNQPALIIHTSGSEGIPKAVKFTHGNLFNFFHYHEITYSQYFAVDENRSDRKPFLTIFPFHHLAGLGICLQGLISCRPTYILRNFTPKLFLRMMEKTRCNLIMLVPSMYRLLLKEKELINMIDLSSLQYCVSLGESTPDYLAGKIETFLGGLVVSAYGMTECYLGIIHSRNNLLHKRIKRGSFGKLFFGEAKLVDARGNENETSGELWIKNSSARKCYLDEKYNGQRFVKGWFRTNDLVYRDAEGDYFHRGRCDDMFVYNGKNIYPVDIESVLAQHPSIDSVCAASVKNHRSETVPAAMVKLKGTITESDIINYFIIHGSIHAVPKFIKIVDELPATGPGKINRIEAAKMLQDFYDEVKSVHPDIIWQLETMDAEN